MGCCLSRARDSSPPDDTQQLNTATTTATTTTHHRHHHHHHHPSVLLADRFNQPLQKKGPWASKKPASVSVLRKARQEFWETRVTGRAEIWGALRTAVELLDSDIATAQTIVDAAGVTVPTGDLSRGVYDEFGHRYDIPEYCFSDPINVVVGGGGGSSDMREVVEMAVEGEESEAEEDLGKGKMPAVEVGREIALKARLSDRGGPDVVVKFVETDSVRRIAQMVHTKAQLPSTQRISLMYLGKILEENKTLLAQGWKRGNVVNALVRAR